MSSFARYAHRAEMMIDRLRPKRGEGDLIIEPYIGYSTSKGVVARGRVLEAPTVGLLDKVLENSGTAGRMLQNFVTSEVAGVELKAGDQTCVSDEEGYFTVSLGNDAVSAGLAPVTIARSGDEFNLPVALTDDNATHAVISDIDDTLIQTGAWQLTRNLWTTFTTSSEERVVFDDTVALIASRLGGVNPVFYVSSSPWNLHQYLLEIFKRANIPMGPIFLRDLGIDETKFIKSSHGSHKGDAINTILAANPDLTFTLVGDTGQHDGTVYLDAIKNNPNRITEVFLRNAGELDAHDADVATKIRSTGTEYYSGQSFDALLS